MIGLSNLQDSGQGIEHVGASIVMLELKEILTYLYLVA